jgi:hypothetical protein
MAEHVTVLRADLAAVHRQLVAAREELCTTKTEFLNFRAAVTHDKQKLAEIARDRMLIQAQIATRGDQLLN